LKKRENHFFAKIDGQETALFWRKIPRWRPSFIKNNNKNGLESHLAGFLLTLESLESDKIAAKFKMASLTLVFLFFLSKATFFFAPEVPRDTGVATRRRSGSKAPL
jgi:hypothetical protein